MGNGRALAQLAIGGSTARYQQIVIVLIVGAGLKAIVTVLTIRSGASGGTLTPSISIGGALGAVAGWGLAYFVPGVNIGQSLAPRCWYVTSSVITGTIDGDVYAH